MRNNIFLFVLNCDNKIIQRKQHPDLFLVKQGYKDDHDKIKTSKT